MDGIEVNNFAHPMYGALNNPVSKKPGLKIADSNNPAPPAGSYIRGRGGYGRALGPSGFIGRGMNPMMGKWLSPICILICYS